MRLQPRVASPASIAVNGAKSVVYTAVLWIVFLFSLPYLIRWAEAHIGYPWMRFDPGGGRIPAAIVFALASLVGFWSGYTLVKIGDGTPMPLECTRNLAIAGPYRYIRNPMSTMGIVQGLCVGLFLGSYTILIYALAGAFVWNTLLRPWEERDLLQRFGTQYENYRREVPCWFPRWIPYEPPAP